MSPRTSPPRSPRPTARCRLGRVRPGTRGCRGSHGRHRGGEAHHKRHHPRHAASAPRQTTRTTASPASGQPSRCGRCGVVRQVQRTPNRAPGGGRDAAIATSPVHLPSVVSRRTTTVTTDRTTALTCTFTDPQLPARRAEDVGAGGTMSVTTAVTTAHHDRRAAVHFRTSTASTDPVATARRPSTAEEACSEGRTAAVRGQRGRRGRRLASRLSVARATRRASHPRPRPRRRRSPRTPRLPGASGRHARSISPPGSTAPSTPIPTSRRTDPVFGRAPSRPD